MILDLPTPDHLWMLVNMATCKKCTSEVKSNQNGVACELCGLWFHTKCVGITNETYKFFKSCCVNSDSDDQGTAANGGVMWFCYDCMGPASKIIKNMSSLHKRQDEFDNELKLSNTRMSGIEIQLLEMKTKLQSVVDDTDMRQEYDQLKGDQLIANTRMSTIEEQINEMNSKMQAVEGQMQLKHESPQWSDIVNQAVDSKLESVSVGINLVEKTIEETKRKTLEFRDKEDRRNNVILYKVPECAPGSYEEVIQHDRDFFLEVCNEGLNLDVTQDDVKKVYRIGRRGTEVRPLLIQLSSGMLKNHIMETTYKLRKAKKFEHIVISHDMTKQERELCRQLVAEAKQQESEEESGEYIFRVRGPPGNMKVVKLRKRM